MSLSSSLYKAARTTRTIEAVASGDPSRIAQRGRNIVIGHTLGSIGFWRWLWTGRG